MKSFPFKLVFINYLRKQGYDPKKLMEDEVEFILQDAEWFLPKEPEDGHIAFYESDFYGMEFEFIAKDGKWYLKGRR